MKLFEKIRRFIRGADRAVTNAICERLDNTAEKLENFARNLDPEAFQESKMRESWEGRPKTDPETAARLAQDARTADAPKTCIVQEKKEVPRWAERHGARRN